MKDKDLVVEAHKRLKKLNFLADLGYEVHVESGGEYGWSSLAPSYWSFRRSCGYEMKQGILPGGNVFAKCVGADELQKYLFQVREFALLSVLGVLGLNLDDVDERKLNANVDNDLSVFFSEDWIGMIQVRMRDIEYADCSQLSVGLLLSTR